MPPARTFETAVIRTATVTIAEMVLRCVMFGPPLAVLRIVELQIRELVPTPQVRYRRDTVI